MDDWVQVGTFAPREKGKEWGKPLYLQKHCIRSGEQTVTVEVPEKPARAGIDPYYLLFDLDIDDNTKKVHMEGVEEEPDSLID